MGVKVTIKGQVYPFDQRYPIHEAIDIEEQAGMTFGYFQQQLQAGSAKAVAVFAWVVLRRDGQDVKLADILSGKYEMATDDVDVEPEGDPEPQDRPTVSPPSSTVTSGGGSDLSPPSSGTRRPRSARSPSPSSTA